VTVVQREKEDAHDYRYFPDPDLPALVVEEAWRERSARACPSCRSRGSCAGVEEMGLGADEGAVLVEERADADLFDDAVDEVVSPGSGGADAAEGEGDGKKQKKSGPAGISRERAGKAVANIVLQQVARLANERGCSLAGSVWTRCRSRRSRVCATRTTSPRRTPGSWSRSWRRRATRVATRRASRSTRAG
jgi:Asp-tRNA(Asn)/Glu-tRNA(Gln) amidotransferase B subunit